MEYSQLAVAAILCSIGYVYCDVLTLPTCTEYPGHLHLFQMDKENVAIIFVMGSSSQATPTLGNLEYVGNDMILDSIPVYNCLGGMDATARLVESNSSATRIDVRNEGAFFSFLPHDGYQQLLTKMRYIVALWTEGGWTNVCEDQSGLVCIWTLGDVDDPTHGTGVVYQIRGASGMGDEPKHKIDQLRSLAIEAVSREAILLHELQVGDCRRAIYVILNNIDNDESDGGIKRMTEFSNIAFYVKEARKDDFMRMVNDGVHQFL